MDGENLNFRIALAADQKENLLKSISDLKREHGLEDEDLSFVNGGVKPGHVAEQESAI